VKSSSGGGRSFGGPARSRCLGNSVPFDENDKQKKMGGHRCSVGRWVWKTVRRKKGKAVRKMSSRGLMQGACSAGGVWTTFQAKSNRELDSLPQGRKKRRW